MSDNPLNKALEAATEPALNIVNPPTRSIGRFFGDTLDFWFSNRELKYAKKKIMDEIALRRFREECEAEFAKIPEEELVPPRKALLLPALDAAEYYVEEEELRRMFARLVAATFDIRKARGIHPSFLNIIQQLSPLDAENLIYIRNECPLALAPAYIENISDDESESIELIPLHFPVIYLKTTDPKNELALQSHSVASLMRLGLVQYSVLYEDETYSIADLAQLALEQDSGNLPEIVSWLIEKGHTEFRYSMGALAHTIFARSFCSVCLPPSKNKRAHP